MRTTVDIDNDILLAAREIAEQQGTSMGKVLSNLARQVLTRPVAEDERDGLPLFPVSEGSGIVTVESVNRLRDEAP